MIKNITAFLILTFFFTCCGQNEQTAEGRWYTHAQVTLGKQVFKKNCSKCHGIKADKRKDWKKVRADGSYPPPPLNGTAHAWHHPLKVLIRTINYGGKPVGGYMPAFQNILTEEEKLAAISYFQSFWNDEIYKTWEERSLTYEKG